MKKILLLVVMLLMVGGIAFAMEGSTDFTKHYTGKGDVTFNHTTHSSVIEDCTVCHIHGSPVQVDKKYGHTECKGCHKLPENEAPTKCGGCHVKVK